jgi:hypothetical protein
VRAPAQTTYPLSLLPLAHALHLHKELRLNAAGRLALITTTAAAQSINLRQKGKGSWHVRIERGKGGACRTVTLERRLASRANPR